MRRFAPLLALLLLSACASAPRTMPADATRITLTSPASPPGLWTAAVRQFASDGWDVREVDAGRLAFIARLPGYDAALNVDVEEDYSGGRVGTARLVVDRPAGSGGAALFRAAAGVLGRLSGQLAYE